LMLTGFCSGRDRKKESGRVGGPQAAALVLVFVLIALWEGDHFDVREHDVFDVDRCDVAFFVGVDEDHAAVGPVVLAVFTFVLDVQFEVLVSHWFVP